MVARLRVACCVMVALAAHTLGSAAWAYSEESAQTIQQVAQSLGSDVQGSATANEDDDLWVIVSDLSLSLGLVDPAQFQQPALPQAEATTDAPLPTAAQSATRQLFGAFGVQRSALAAAPAGPAIQLTGASQVLGREAVIRATTDAADLLGSSPSVLNLGIQRRNPVVTDPRVRGSRVGSLAASGSYWVPARIDLDTVLSKIDSRIVERMTVIPGPYSALYGPGFEFVDVELLRAPRYSDGYESHAQSSVDFKTNGDHWYGRQSGWGGAADWGFRLGYGHRTGNDYVSGDNVQIPSSFKSREVDAALGAELTDDSSIDFNYLRLDQTDVELAGQAFDLDYLFTDGYEVAYVLRDQPRFDELLVESWYNRTVFAGSAQRAGKRSQFPFYDFIDFVGNTDVDSMSVGYRAAFRWFGEDEQESLTAGADLRYVKQELNELTSGRIGAAIWDDANSPIPRSHSANPGLFAELTVPVNPESTATVGARVDWVEMNIEESADDLSEVGILGLPAEDILGSDAYDQSEPLGAGYFAVDRQFENGWGCGISCGYAERAPNLTERYAIQPFMFLIQNGLNTVTGDPELDKERLVQIDVRLSKETERFRGTATAYYGWAFDYITFENLSIVRGPPFGQVEQVNLKYVNTARATLWGMEARAEYEVADWMTPFATIKYVQGDDRTRNGDFATRQATSVSPSEQVPGLPRGFFSTVAGAATEPLPSILPLDSRIGVRFVEPGEPDIQGIEVSVRIVDNQDRVAASLLETPTPGFAVWDLRAYARPMDGVLLVAGIENFTDNNYREHLDFRAENGIEVLRPGINFYFGSELTY